MFEHTELITIRWRVVRCVGLAGGGVVRWCWAVQMLVRRPWFYVSKYENLWCAILIFGQCAVVDDPQKAPMLGSHGNLWGLRITELHKRGFQTPSLSKMHAARAPPGILLWTRVLQGKLFPAQGDSCVGKTDGWCSVRSHLYYLVLWFHYIC